METNLSRQLVWIAAADSKASFIFAFDTAMLGVLAALAPTTGSDWSIAPAIFASTSVLFGFCSIIFLSLASFPRTKGPKNSMIFFAGISQRELDQFEQAVSNLTSDSYIADLSAQCHRNAQIAELKFKWLRNALVALYLSVLPWLLAIVMLFSG